MNQKIALFFTTIVCLSGSLAHALVRAQISQQGDTVHLEFEGQAQWDYELKKVNQKGKALVQLTLPKLTDKSESQFKSFSHSLIKEITIDPNGPDGKSVISFQLANAGIEPFDYLTEKPSRLIVDFYKGNEEPKAEKPAPTKGEKTSKKQAVKETPKKEVAQKTLPAKGATRAPASPDVLVINDQGQQVSLDDALSGKKTSMGGIFDGGDPNYDRFSIKDYEIKENAIIASRNKMYIDFPMLRIRSPYLELLQTKKPVYEIVPQETEENKQARLLLTLFENKRYNVFLKSADWFFQKYPQSQYDEMIRFMLADSLFAIWTESHRAEDFDLAMLRYRQALEKYPESPLLERTMMLMGFATLDRGDYLGTLRLFQSHLQKRPSSPNKDIARFAIADAFMKINRFDEATQIYGEIEKDAFEEKDKVQAAYLRGDVAYQKKDFRTAIDDYQAALKKYPQSTSDFPNAIYNQAAAYWGLKDYRKSLELYGEFIKKFPNHPEAGFAMTRIGELQDILGADPTKVLGTYLETYFRYGDSPSAVVARLRMLSERMHAMKPKEVEKAVKDIQELAKNSNLPKMDQFATVMISEGFNQRKEYDRAVQLLVKFYQDNPTQIHTEPITNRIVKNINDDLRDLVDKGEFIKALKLHNKYSDDWLKNSNRIDTRYNVGRAFEQAGAFKQADRMYQETLNKIFALKGTSAGKERSVIENLPSEDEVHLRLASVEAAQGKYAQAFEALKNIKNPGALKDREQIERVQLASRILDKKGETESAIRYLTELLKEWSGIPEIVAEPYLELAQMEIKLNKTDDAIKSLKKIDTLMEDSKKVAAPTHARALEILGGLQMQSGHKDEAIQTFEKLLSQYEKARPLASYRYKVGQHYFEKGEVKKAAEVWNELQAEKNDFWYKLGQEQLRGSEWKDEYKKYIKRIPAMSQPEAQAERK